jgi:hypothetical protein
MTLDEIGRGAYSAIIKLVAPLGVEASEEEARERIWEDALSVLVRSDWHVPGERDGNMPANYAILITTGGPAVRIRGELDAYCQPRNAWLEVQDWGTPWTQYTPVDEDTLLAYANCFCFGE